MAKRAARMAPKKAPAPDWRETSAALEAEGVPLVVVMPPVVVTPPPTPPVLEGAAVIEVKETGLGVGVAVLVTVRFSVIKVG